MSVADKAIGQQYGYPPLGGYAVILTDIARLRTARQGRLAASWLGLPSS